MKFDRKQVLHLADLAKLNLSDKEAETYKEQLKDILVYVDKINKLDLDNVKESLSGVENNNVGPRPDEVSKSQPETIKQACYIQDDYVSVPNVFEK